MFAVIYSFKVKKDHDQIFRENWKSLTKLIYQYEGSLGSRLHKANDNLYIAYARWPNRTAWENAGKNLPEIAHKYRIGMKESCEEITTDHELNIEDDLLMTTTYNK